MNPGSKAAPVPPARSWLTPGEFSAALADLGLSLCTKEIYRRVNLPASDAKRIHRHPSFHCRIYIPVSEVARIGLAPVNA